MSGVRRKAAINYKPAEKGVSLTTLKGSPHFHFCKDRECRQIYEDTCEQPEINGPCQTCRGVKRELMRHRDPHECCIGNTDQIIARQHIIRYALAGPGPWYQCRTCARCHGWPCN